jgi:hypothetical protein
MPRANRISRSSVPLPPSASRKTGATLLRTYVEGG